ncbi:ribosome silencing factor [Candidatus Aerophobetes bacterium]|nr:ribosome silencing factor [Candidatus Aerophobetes bacterium]
MVSREIAEEAIKIVKDKKGKDIILLDLKGISIIADYFIICGGESPVHMRSIAQEIEKKFKEKGIKLLNPQDFWDNVWILLDFGTVVIHIFSKEGREFYQLERLWADASKIVSTH